MLSRRHLLFTAASPLLGADPAPLELRTNTGKAAAQLYSGDQWDKPFLYPIRTVSGIVLSRGWPLNPQPGDSTDHTWHRGFWYGHGLINTADFWRELGRDKTSRLIPKRTPAERRGKGSIHLAMTPPNGTPIGSMQQQFAFRDEGPLRFLDATITIHADAAQSLTFGDTDDGGFAFRLAEAFREDRGARLRNSEGLTGSKQIWGKPARWTDYTATINNTLTGVALFDHPANLRHPTTWHARGYGLNAANPFARKSFDKSAADGSHTLPAGRSLTLRYRAVVYEGSPDLEALWKQYART